MLTKKASLELFLKNESSELCRLAAQIIENEATIHGLRVVTTKKVVDAIYRMRGVGRRVAFTDVDADLWWQRFCAANDINPQNLPLHNYYITEDAYRKPRDASYFNTIPVSTLPEISQHFPEIIKFKQFNPIEEKIQQTIAQLKLRMGAKNLSRELDNILKREDGNSLDSTEFRRNIS
ncbi:hypothetical protein FD723_40335 (plasmid) [Nostoc sp. C052]|uniref:hypothetical protein n=1 Tax=Nostoc sp. C052 TaxID=2576902 RepID=UPI0015C2FF7F|nr:hypothetical protein [Nostoc sp. C052]QLE46463.1 hypothetical protein FD723_40335 [Nostoc sp. C052]